MPLNTSSKGSDDEERSSDLEDEDEDGNNGQQRRAPRNSKGNGKDDPQTLQYYSGTWKSVLHTTKKRFREHVVSTDPFPSRQSDEDMHVATALLAEVKAEFEAQHRRFDPGTIVPPFVNYYDWHFHSWAPSRLTAISQTPDMSALVCLTFFVKTIADSHHTSCRSLTKHRPTARGWSKWPAAWSSDIILMC